MSLEKAERFTTAAEEEGQHRRQRQPFSVAREDSSSSFLFQATNFLGSNGPSGTHRELFGFSDQSHHHQQPSDLFSLEESKCLGISLKDQTSCDGHGFPAGRIRNGPIKWMSSKMRVMRKMMAEERNKPRRRMHRPPQFQQPLLSRDTDAEIRVCSCCSTTKTPLWRSGPQGPKSLCNACGIRRMKARRAVAAASAASPQRAELIVPYKKRHKFTGPLPENSPSSSSTFHPAFPQDEKEAAVLLMALSCG